VSPKLIVADAGPLIALAVGGVLSTCLKMLGGLHVPQLVLDECCADPMSPGAAEIQQLLASGQLHSVAHSLLAPRDAAFAQGLGSGEVAVLSYAKEHGLLALVDERRARRVARLLKVAVIGSGALLVLMKRQALIVSIEPVFAAWQAHGYFVSDMVKAEIPRLG
jgi:predicted nucleic acid-binding protein